MATATRGEGPKGRVRTASWRHVSHRRRTPDDVAEARREVCGRKWREVRPDAWPRRIAAGGGRGTCMGDVEGRRRGRMFREER